MSTVNVVLKLDKTMASKLPITKCQLDKGKFDMLLIDCTVRESTTMMLIMTWMACNQGEEDPMAVAGASGGHLKGSESANSELEDFIIKFAVKQGIPVLIELIEATIKLEVWPFFELACKTMANLIKDKDVDGVRQLLQLNSGTTMTTSCIEGFVKYLSIMQRLDLDDIELKEWQLASNRLWSEQKVLYFGNTAPILDKSSEYYNRIELQLNHVECSKEELAQNVTSVKTGGCRILSEKFLKIVRRCVNLEAISWDTNFGQMADTKLARVLEHNCPHLVHIQGWIKQQFEFKINVSKCLIQPASFLEVFEPPKNMSYLVKYEHKLTTEQMRTFEFERLVKHVDGLNFYDLDLVEPTVTSTWSKLALNEYWYLVDKQWFDKMKKCPTTIREKISNRSLLNFCNGNYQLKEGLERNEDYILVHQGGWQILVDTFGLIDDHQVIKRPVVYNRSAKSNVVEVYEIELVLTCYGVKRETMTRKFSIAIGYDDLVKQLKRLFGDYSSWLWINFELVECDCDGGFKAKSGKVDGKPVYEPRCIKDKDIVTLVVLPVDFYDMLR